MLGYRHDGMLANSARPYEGMNIEGAANLTEAEIGTLKALGADVKPK